MFQVDVSQRQVRRHLGKLRRFASARAVQLAWPAQGMGEGVLDETNRLTAVRRQYGAKTHLYALHSSQLTKTR